MWRSSEKRSEINLSSDNPEDGDTSFRQRMTTKTRESRHKSAKGIARNELRTEFRLLPSTTRYDDSLPPRNTSHLLKSHQRVARVQFTEEGRVDEDICGRFQSMELTDKNNKRNPVAKQTYKAKNTRMNNIIQIPEKTKPLIELKDERQLEEDTIYSDSSATTSEEEIDYELMPQEPYQLDEYEKEVHASFKIWRFQRKNELDVESQNRRLACQDRTICELIRRRRNDFRFALQGHVGHKAAVVQLLSVWGIGPAKAAADGVGWEMLDVLDSENNLGLLELSRGHHHRSDPVVLNHQVKSAEPRIVRKRSVVVHKKSQAKNPTPKVPRYIAFCGHQSPNRMLSNRSRLSCK